MTSEGHNIIHIEAGRLMEADSIVPVYPYFKGGLRNLWRAKSARLEDFLSYDEVKIAALLQLSSPSHCINNGDRNNVGKPSAPGKHIKMAILE